MKLKYNFVTNEVADQIVAVAVGDDLEKFNGFIKMNKTGAEIFDLLKNDISMDDLVAEMAKLYPDETKETVVETVKGFVEQLKNSCVIE